MRKLVLVTVVLVVALAVFFGRTGAADGQAAAPGVYPEAKLSGDVLLVNLKSVDVPFMLKSHEVVTLAGVPFLQGVVANIGDEERDAGLTVLLAVYDIAVIRQFTWAQAKARYINSFREDSPDE